MEKRLVVELSSRSTFTFDNEEAEQALKEYNEALVRNQPVMVAKLGEWTHIFNIQNIVAVSTLGEWD